MCYVYYDGLGVLFLLVTLWQFNTKVDETSYEMDWGTRDGDTHMRTPPKSLREKKNKNTEPPMNRRWVEN